MSDPEAGPPEREVGTLKFQQLCRLKVFEERPETLSPKERSQLLTTSNKYGYTFAGTNRGVAVIQTSVITQCHEDTDTSNGIVTVESFGCERVPLPNKPLHLALSVDELILSVCYVGDTGLKVELYDVRVLVKKSSAKVPFTSTTLSREPGCLVVDLKWNPGQPTFFATCLSDGSLAFWDCSADLKLVAGLPKESGSRAICWSPKGKQIVVGTSAGKLTQYNHKMEQKKVVGAPDFSTEPVKVVDVMWLSTYIFAVAYIDVDDNIQPNLTIVSAPKDQPTTFMNFEDVCFGTGEERMPHYFLQLLDKWDLMIACSSNAMEAVVLGKQLQDKSKWEIWTLDDAARMELPLCDNEEQFPMGMTLSFNSQVVIKLGERQLPPVPLLLVLSTEGLLCPFYVVNTDATEGITTRPEPLPTGGERIGTGIPFQPVAKPAAPVSAQPATPAQKQFTFTPAQQPAAPGTGTAPSTTSTFGSSGFGGFGTPSSTSSAFSVAQPASPSGFSFTAPKTTAPPAFGTSSTTTTAGLFGKPIGSTPVASTTGPASFSFTKPAVASSTSPGAASFSFVSPKPVTPAAAATAQPAKPPSQPTFSFKAGNNASGSAFSFTSPQPSAAPAPSASSSFSFVKPQPSQATVPAAPQSAGASTGLFSFQKTPTAATPLTATQPQQLGSGVFSVPKPTDVTDSKAVPSSVPPKLINTTPAVLPPTTTPSPFGATSLSSLLGAKDSGGPPPNVVAPPNTVAPSSIRTSVGPPNAVAPPSSRMFGAPTPSTNQLPQRQVAPSAAANYAQPFSTPGVKPSAVPPNQITPSGDGSMASTTKAPGFGKPAAVSVAKPTPAVSKPAVKHALPGSEGRQMATPTADHAAIDSALFSNIKEVREHFKRDKADLATQVDEMINSEDNLEEDELSDLRLNVDQLTSYRKELVDWSKSLNEEVHDIKNKLFSTFSQVEEAKVRQHRNNDPRYVQLLRTRGLDPQTARKMKEIRSMHHYIETGIRDVNSCLDAEWEDLQQKRSSRKGGRKMATPTMEAIYQTLSNNYNVIITQRGRLEELRSRLKRARKYDISTAPWQDGTLPSPAPRREDTDLASLADTMAKARIRSPPKARIAPGTPVSAKKQSQLRDVLSRRTHTPLRAAPIESCSDIASEASSYTFENTTPRVQPTRRLFLSEADEDAEYCEDDVGSEELYAPDEQDSAVFAGRRNVTDFRKDVGIMGVAKSGGALGALDKPRAVSDDRSRLMPASAPFSRPAAPASTVPPTVPHIASRPVPPAPSHSGLPPSTKQISSGPSTLPTSSSISGPPVSSLASFAPPKSTPSPSSGFSHTGLGTVAWGATDPAKLSPSQAAGVAALSRLGTKPPASSAPPVKAPPPVVNVKNLDTMRESMPPPVTFAPVASSVDAGTAKVVNQVIAEMAATSGVSVPPPGSPAAGAKAVTTTSSFTAPVSSTYVTQDKPSTPVATPTGGFSFAPKQTTAMIKSASTSALPSMNTAGAKTTASTGFSFTASQSGSPGFSFGGSGGGGVFGGSGTSGGLFGAKTAMATVATPSAGVASTAPSSSKPAQGFTFGSSSSATSAATPDEQTANQNNTSVQPSDTSSTPPSRAAGTTSPPGVKPNLFDFKSSTSTAASTSTPGGFFMGGQSASAKGVQPSDDVQEPFYTSSPTVTATTPPAHIVTTPPQPTASSTPFPSKPPSQEAKPSLFGNTTLAGLLQTQSAKVVSDDPTIPGTPNIDEAGTGKVGGLFGQPAKPIGSAGPFGSLAAKPVGVSQPAGEDEAGTGLANPPNVVVEATDSTKPSAVVSSGTAGTTSAAAGFSFAPKPSASGGATLAGLLGAPSTAASSAPQSTTTGATPATTGASGFSFAPTAAKSLFGQPAAPPATTATTTTASNGFSFGSKPVFGDATPASSTSGFGGSSGGSVFGTPAASSSSGTVFGATATTAASTGPFGTSTSSAPAFGSAGGSGFGSQSAAPAFGSSTFGSSTPATSGGDVFGGGGGGFFSGLGGQPNPEAAKTNPFGTPSAGTTESAFGTSAASTGGLFGGGAKTFGETAGGGGFGGGGGFSSGGGGVANSGFGFAQQPAAPAAGGFGSAPAFGSSPAAAFGSPPVFEAPAAGGFGSAPAFGSTPAAAAFGSPPAFGGGATFGSPSFSSPFGGGAAPGGSNSTATGGGFGGFAAQDTPSFGNIASPSSGGGGFGAASGGGGFGAASGGGGFGAASPSAGFGGGFGAAAPEGNSGFGGFGGSGTTGGFGTGNTGGNTSFGGGSSFSQYR